MIIFSVACLFIIVALVGSSADAHGCSTEVQGLSLKAHCSSLDLGVVGIRLLASDLENTKSHVTSMALDLQHNNIGDVGVRVLSGALQKADLLSVSLQLDGNGLKDDAARALGAALAKLQSLEFLSLSLGFNDIACQGLGDLAAGIAKLTQLRKLTLVLRYNQIQSSGVGSFGKSVSDLKALESLEADFYSNAITNSGVKDVVESVAGLAHLASVSLDFRYNDVDTSKSDDLLEVVDKVKHMISHNRWTVLLPPSVSPTVSPEELLGKSLIKRDDEIKKFIKAFLDERTRTGDGNEYQGSGDWRHGASPQKLGTPETRTQLQTTIGARMPVVSTTIRIRSDSVTEIPLVPSSTSDSAFSVFKLVITTVFSIAFIAMAGAAILWQNGYNVAEVFQNSTDYIRDLIQSSNTSVRQFASSWPEEGNYRVNLSEDTGNSDIVVEAPMVEQKSQEPDLATRVDMAAAKVAASQRAPSREMSIEELMGANLSRLQSSDRME